MAKGAAVQRFMLGACLAVVIGSISGFGLGRFAAGGAPAYVAYEDDRGTELGRQDALVADQDATVRPSYDQIIPTTCIGCGPGLAERQAIAEQRKMEEEIARRSRVDVGEWVPAETAYPERLVPAAEPVVRPLEGSSAALIEGPV